MEKVHAFRSHFETLFAAHVQQEKQENIIILLKEFKILRYCTPSKERRKLVADFSIIRIALIYQLETSGECVFIACLILRHKL
jgi:hypothetical protein